MLLAGLVWFCECLRADPPTCAGANVALTADYSYFIGSAGFVSPSHEPESGSAFRWMTNGSTAATGMVAEDLLLHFDLSPDGVNGEAPVTSLDLAFAPGKWGQALALPPQGRLNFSRAANLHLDEGTIELWVALRDDGADPVYSARDHVLFRYRAPNGDYVHIDQSGAGHILYAGGMVNGQWQSAWGSMGNMSEWHAGDWHHLAYTYSVRSNFMRFYVDGCLVAQNNEGHYWAPDAGGATFSVGWAGYGDAAHYWIDEVRVSGRVADAAEIAARARRAVAAQPNEVWLGTSNAVPNALLTFEFTPATVTETGAPCTSAQIPWNGIPITHCMPASTLLPPGTTNMTLHVDTAANTTCAYSVGTPLPFDEMIAFDSGAGTRHHSALISLVPDPNVVNDVFVRCAAGPDYVAQLQFRALSEVNPPYPRTGNLWGWWHWRTNGLPYMSKVDLWLGATPTSEEAIGLRQLNPHLRILISINAVENTGLPDDYYLKDIHGNTIEVWPGSFRLNLTKPHVAEYQARFAYQTVLDTGLAADGVFFDNVMTSQSWQTSDIYGNPVEIDADEDGVADEPAVFDAVWKAGVLHEIAEFRQLMPHAIICAHASDPDLMTSLNGISIGFKTSDVLENRLPFFSLFTIYSDWISRAVPPAATMIESSPMAQISYGYDYSPWAKIPPDTLEFARTYFPYVRFGLALTLLNDGFFAHEFGDTWHGNDWWYDELNFNLGYPLGPAQALSPPGPPPANILVNGSFEEPIAEPWRFAAGTGCAAAVSRQAGGAPDCGACARVDIGQTTGTDWHIEFAQYNRSLVQGTGYELTFWARSSTNRSVTLSAQRSSADWRNYGLNQRLSITTNWQQHTVAFTANETVSDARIQFFCGERLGSIWLDDVQLTTSQPRLYRRDFNNGIVLLNASRDPAEINLGPGFHRLAGEQAPLREMILDDGDSLFWTTDAWTNAAYDSGLWKAAGPFYHSWAGALRERMGDSGQAGWQLPPLPPDTYEIAAWWPAAPHSTNWSGQTMFEVLDGNTRVGLAQLDQTAGGDQWHHIASVPLSGTTSVCVRVSAPSGVCVADAIWVRSQARYNDGAPVSVVTLQPMDGIVLRRDEPVLNMPRFGSITRQSGSLQMQVTDLTPGIGWTLERCSIGAVGVWQPVQSFQTLGFTTNLVDALPPAFSGFYRLRSQ